MRRRILTAAAALALAAALATPALATATAHGRPAGVAVTTSPATTPPVTTSPATPAPSDSATVCLTTAATVTKGLEAFVADMRKVGQLAQQGDLTGAEQVVKQGGARLVAIGTQLRADAVNAAGNLKQTVNTMADEFQALGRSLTSLSSLQNFDTAKLDALAARMGELCGVSPSPGRGSSVPLPSRSPTG